MPEKRAPHGVPVPSLLQLALFALAICAGWAIWSQWRGSTPLPGDQRDDSTEVAAGLENLRRMEAVAEAGADGLPDLVANLTNTNPRIRRNAILALRRIGPDAREALAPIRERFADDDAQARRHAISAYWYIRRDPVDVAVVVAPMLEDGNADVREVAATVLETIGPPAVEPIATVLRGGVAAARVPALQLLRRTGWDEPQPETEDVLHELARDSDSGVRREALLTLAAAARLTPVETRELLGTSGPDRSAPGTPYPELIPQRSALLSIIRSGPAAAENLPDVMLLLSDQPDGELPRMALAAVRSMKESAQPAVPGLLKRFVDLRHSLDVRVGWTLLEIGADPSEIARIAVPFAGDSNTEACFHAGRLCASAVPDEARKLVSALIPKLASEDAATRQSALYAIWGLAPEAQEAAPALALLLQEHDPHVARAAAKALRDIGPDAAPAIPAIRAALARRSPPLAAWARGAMFEALGQIGPAARSALPDLLAELRDPRFLAGWKDHNDYPCFEAISALAAIGEQSPEALSGLRALLSSRIWTVQRDAFRALVRLAPDSPDLLNDLSNWLAGGQVDNYGRLETILAIGTLHRQDAVQPLVEALTDRDVEVRKAAAWALGETGPAAQGALPALREALAEWKNSFRPRRPANWPDYDDPYSRIETSRWQDVNRATSPDWRNRRLWVMSVEQVVREAIAAIESEEN